jgi:hypothetical protein
MFDGESINIKNMSWMKVMDISFISSIPVEDMGGQVSKTVNIFCHRKSDRHF